MPARSRTRRGPSAPCSAPGAAVGCAAETVVGGDREVEEQAAVSLWAGHTGPVAPFHLRLETTPDGDTLVGWPDPVPDAPSALLLLADPFSFPADAFLARAGDDFPTCPSSAAWPPRHAARWQPARARRPGGRQRGRRGVPGARHRRHHVVSQGCRPVGDPSRSPRRSATSSTSWPDGPRSSGCRTSPAARRTTTAGSSARVCTSASVIDEQQATYDRGDFLIRNLIGADPDNGAIAVGDLVEVGQTAQFQVRDAASADEDLRELMSGRIAEAALLFTCNGRGSRLFGAPDHDAEVVADTSGTAPSPACRVPVSSARSGAATSCTGSPHPVVLLGPRPRDQGRSSGTQLADAVSGRGRERENTHDRRVEPLRDVQALDVVGEVVKRPAPVRPIQLRRTFASRFRSPGEIRPE